MDTADGITMCQYCGGGHGNADCRALKEAQEKIFRHPCERAKQAWKYLTGAKGIRY